MPQTLWPTKLKIFTLWPLTEQVCLPLSCGVTASVTCGAIVPGREAPAGRTERSPPQRTQTVREAQVPWPRQQLPWSSQVSSLRSTAPALTSHCHWGGTPPPTAGPKRGSKAARAKKFTLFIAFSPLPTQGGGRSHPLVKNSGPRGPSSGLQPGLWGSRAGAGRSPWPPVVTTARGPTSLLRLPLPPVPGTLTSEIMDWSQNRGSETECRLHPWSGRLWKSRLNNDEGKAHKRAQHAGPV